MKMAQREFAYNRTRRLNGKEIAAASPIPGHDPRQNLCIRVRRCKYSLITSSESPQRHNMSSSAVSSRVSLETVSIE